ncbi:MAG: AtpZ/AtpI family protein [Candidatus Melainabacteria bacterium]|nr:AtpZ/AtpI family protein [Candidatus Melainabacteria bacterium]
MQNEKSSQNHPDPIPYPDQVEAPLNPVEPAADSISDQPGGPPAWVVASQWGVNLTVLTCLFGYAGFWLGQQMHNNALSFFLTLLGIILGFIAGIYRMIKGSEALKRKQKSDKQTK